MAARGLGAAHTHTHTHKTQAGAGQTPAKLLGVIGKADETTTKKSPEVWVGGWVGTSAASTGGRKQVIETEMAKRKPQKSRASLFPINEGQQTVKFRSIWRSSGWEVFKAASPFSAIWCH